MTQIHKRCLFLCKTEPNALHCESEDSWLNPKPLSDLFLASIDFSRRVFSPVKSFIGMGVDKLPFQRLL